MAKYFYSDANGRKQGPLDDQQLKALAAQRVIKPTTPLETDTGYKGLAGQIPGLFGTTTAPPAPPPAPPEVPTSPPVPSAAASVREWVGATAAKGAEWSKEAYQKAVPFVAKATEFSKEVGQKSKSGASLLDAIFDVHFTRFFTVPWTTALWIACVILHFMALFVAIGVGGWGGARYVAEERTVYANARAQYVEAMTKYRAEMERYKTEMEMYKEFERWQQMPPPQRGEERQKMERNRERERERLDWWNNWEGIEIYKEFERWQRMSSQQRKEEKQRMEQNREMEKEKLDRWSNWERGNTPLRPNEPQRPDEPAPPERPKYTGPTWQVVVYPVVYVGIVLFIFSISLCIARMLMEFVIISFRNEKNTRVTKDHYLRMEKALKYDDE